MQPIRQNFNFLGNVLFPFLIYLKKSNVLAGIKQLNILKSYSDKKSLVCKIMVTDLFNELAFPTLGCV